MDSGTSAAMQSKLQGLERIVERLTLSVHRNDPESAYHHLHSYNLARAELEELGHAHLRVEGECEVVRQACALASVRQGKADPGENR